MAESLSIVCWNVHYPRFAQDNGYVIEALDKHGPFDIICLQEYVQGKDKAAEAAEWFKVHDYDTTYLPFAHNLDGLSQGVMTATRKSLKAKVTPFVLREDGPRRFRPFPNVRGLLAASVKIGDEAVTIMNFHSTYPRPHVIDMRRREFASLKNLLSAETKKNPWFLCGDFNFLSVDKRRKYLTDRFQSYTGSLFNKTWRHHSKYTPVRGNLDYFFWNELNVAGALAPFSDSDHRPLVGTITLK